MHPNASVSLGEGVLALTQLSTLRPALGRFWHVVPLASHAQAESGQGLAELEPPIPTQQHPTLDEVTQEETVALPIT